ncbi:MAG TPA: PEP-CTERM sorting domain-containing protein [Bryobacteraceae bacterium]|nr:PEP-CTERM sorting domain-containing protein [Bryobacteraceae bacterium]
MVCRFLVSSALLAASFVPAAVASSIVAILPPSGYSYVDTVAINNNGQIATTVTKSSNGVDLTAIDTNGTFAVSTGNTQRTALAINDSGKLVGYSTSGSGAPAAYSQTGTATTNLTAIAHNQGSIASSINDAGTIVGVVYTQSGFTHAFSYTGTTMTDIGTIGSGTDSYAYDINSSGMIVGAAGVDPNSGGGHAFSYTTSGGMQFLAGLNTVPSTAWAVNDAGEIAGDESPLGESNAFIYLGGIVTDLGTLGGSQSFVAGINSSGIVVGSSDLADGSSTAFYYTGTGGMLDLNTLLPANSGWVLQGAEGINDSGQIVGYGLFNGTAEAFLMNTDLGAAATPEPGTVVLLTMGAGIIAFVRKQSVK